MTKATPRAKRINTAHKGRRAEHRARKILTATDHWVSRAAASKGPADLIAWNDKAVRFISVKSGGKYLSAKEREAMLAMPVPPGGTREVWRFPDRCKEPSIEVIQ